MSPAQNEMSFTGRKIVRVHTTVNCPPEQIHSEARIVSMKCGVARVMGKIAKTRPPFCAQNFS